MFAWAFAEVNLAGAILDSNTNTAFSASVNGAVGGLGYGVVTGIVLGWLLNQSQGGTRRESAVGS